MYPVFIAINAVFMVLTEIKKGQTGTGLLIENDGYVSLDMPENKILKEAFGIEGPGQISAKDLPRPFVVSAVFQKFGIENANGRIYPEDVLRRAVDKYMANIEDRRGYGECYKPSAMILTETGWKKLSEVKTGENVLTLNSQTGIIEIQPIDSITKRHADELVHIQGRSINDYVTEGHGYPIFGRNNKFKGFYTAKDIMEGNVPDEKHCYIPKTGKWDAVGDEFFTIPAIDSETLSKIPSKALREKYSKDLVIPIDVFAKFMGIYLSEGSHSKSRSYKVNIHQKKEDVCEEIEKMLEELGLGFTINVSKSGAKTFVISDMRLHRYVKQFGLCYDKYVPYEIKKQSKETLRTFYDWFVMGDGRTRGDKRRKSGNLSDDVFTTSQKMAMDLNEIQLKIGYSGVFHEDGKSKDRTIENRVIKSENSHPLYFTYKSLTKGIYLDDRFLKITKEKYDGDVMCVEVKNHIWYVCDGGKCHWTKNCNHPSESSIDLGRLAMNIVELHWEGHTLVGKMEIPITDGFRNLGIVSTLADMIAQWLISGLKIGVSSRGLGSVTKQFNKLIVGDDYEIVCWDVVAQPSTPLAFIGMQDKDIAPYVESEKKKGEKLNENKFEKFDKWLLK